MNPIGKMTKRPFGEEYMRDAFLGLVHFLISDDEKSKPFYEGWTEQDFKDALTKDQKQAFGEFADWVAEHHWGLEE